MDLLYLRSIGLSVAGVEPVAPMAAAASRKPRPTSDAAPLVVSSTASAPSPGIGSSGGVRGGATATTVGHAKELPSELAARILTSDVRILGFLLRYLESVGLGSVPVFINGGYVRDLLRGKEPDDLDLSICLRSCSEDVTVAGLLERLPAYAAEHPDLGVVEVKVATILSNESKDKQLDTFKAHFTDDAGKKTEVDVMPTIGEETYGEDNRIPIRDQRGTAEEDALRRDLTIGALLLRVALADGGGLRYELLDFYGGVEDLRLGILRSPYPAAKRLSEVRAMVLRTPAEEQLASALGLDSAPQQETLQVLWWAKVLMDDPLRICRALRFEAKLRFKLHSAFWLAAPFALEALRSKIAGGRKNTEYQKLAGYGFQACRGFFEVAFGQTFGPKRDTRLAPALFGGQDEKGRPKLIPEITSFDSEAFGTAASEFAQTSEEAELTGGLLAAALSAAEFREGAGAVSEEFGRACDGMCVSNAMREAGASVLQATARLVAKPPVPGRLETGVAAACNMSAAELCHHVQVSEALQLCAPRAGPPSSDAPRRRLALALLDGCQQRGEVLVDAGSVRRAVEALAFDRPAVRGSVLGILEVPPVLRRQVMVLLDVALRLLRCAEPLETSEQAQQLFSAQPRLGEALAKSVWFEADGKTLREEFQPPKKGKK